MRTVKLFSWNVNGLRSAYGKGFPDWFSGQKADIVCVQETRARAEQIPEKLKDIPGYQAFFSEPSRKGYSGVGLWSVEKPRSISWDMGVENLDMEGRLILAEYRDFVLLNVYFPNGKASTERLKYKLDFYNAFLECIIELKSAGKNVIFCGDVNTAHREIDLARPKENEKISGFLPEERAWIDCLTTNGFIDTFRFRHPEPGQYTWWDLKSRARERNVGWRIDYFFVSDNLKERIKSAFIQPEVFGSDHCPVGLEINL